MKINIEQLGFFLEIGRSLAQWSYVETQLINVVSHCLKDHKHTVALGFLSIENFRSKLQFCNNLMQHKFGANEHIGRWNAIHGKLGTLSRKRNKFAHSVVVLYVDSMPGRRFALVPWIDKQELFPTINATPIVHKAGGKAIPPADSLCLRDIVGLREEFHALTTSLANLDCLLSGRAAPFPEPSEPIVAPELQTIESQIQQEFGIQLSPSPEKL